MTDASVAISVLIPTHGRPVLLRRTLESLAACRLPGGYQEAVVVENGSRDGAEGIVEGIADAYPELRLRYMHVGWGNKSHALNEALETVEDGLVVFFDDDVRLEPGVLIAYARAADEVGQGAFFGGPFGVDYEKRPREWMVRLFPRSAQGMELEGHAPPREYLGCNWAAFRSDMRNVGGFDPNYGPGSPTGSTGQETDMQRRLKREGVAARNVPGARVWHYVPVSRSSLRWLVQRMFRSGTHQGISEARMSPGALVSKVVRDSVRYSGRVVKYGLRGDQTEVGSALLKYCVLAGYVKGQMDQRRREKT